MNADIGVEIIEREQAENRRLRFKNERLRSQIADLQTALNLARHELGIPD